LERHEKGGGVKEGEISYSTYYESPKFSGFSKWE